MELDNCGAGALINEELTPFTKESRAVRKEKIERNNQFHRKNSKSIAYYEQKDSLILTDEKLTIVSQDNSITGNIMKDTDLTSASKKTKKLKSTIGITTQKTNTNSVATHLQKSSPKKSNYVKKHSKHFTEVPQTSQPVLSVKLKGNLQLMFQNLSKHYKKDGLFLDNSEGFDHIIVMKDFNVNTNIGKTKTNLSLRSVVGKYTNLRAMVIEHGTQFSTIKTDFHDWWTNAINNFDAKDALDTQITQLFDSYNTDPRIAKFLPSLEDKLLQALKKPTKQPHGFSKKISQIDSHWSEEAKEIVHIEAIENELRFSSYEESFPLARSMNRKFSIFIGPTNSGKTYAALNTLAQARSGSYLGPLRLMAHEGKESLLERGIIANLVTGEERTEILGATHVSSTVEMCNMSRMVDVAVIDEIQMIADESRGWAWSQALIGAPARHVVLVGSEESLPFILPIIKNLGEEYEIQRFERKTPLHIHDPIWKFKDLKENDCVVVFSRKAALEMKNAIEATGKRCSVIYGNLSPEVRRTEAAKFKSGENPILVATDAIGMGLNLPINRLFFSTMEKYDGFTTRLLSISEIKQIAGRAGRYGFASHGEVGVLFDDNNQWRTLLHKAIYAGYEKADDVRIPIAPNLKQIQTICNTLGKQDLYTALIFFKEKMIRDHKLYKTANLDSMIEIASLIKNKNFDLATGLNYACVPLDTGSDVHIKSFFKWLNNHLNQTTNLAPALPDVVTDKKNDSYSLYEAENYVKLCMAYRWLHYKYPEIYNEINIVTEQAKTTNDYIEHALHRHIVISQNPKWKR